MCMEMQQVTSSPAFQRKVEAVCHSAGSLMEQCKKTGVSKEVAQIAADLGLQDVIKEKTALDPDRPGLGQFYCIACCRYCISQRALDDHERTSKHKRRLKMLLTETPYSHAEATGTKLIVEFSVLYSAINSSSAPAKKAPAWGAAA